MGIWKDITPACIRDFLASLTTTSRLSADSVKEGSVNLFLTVAERAAIVAALLQPGMIIMAGNTAPAGWLLCDGKTLGDSASGADYANDTYKPLYDYLQAVWGGTFNWAAHNKVNLPDWRGVYPKGAGTTSRGLGKDANGNYYAATLGAYVTDKMQGHYHIRHDWTIGITSGTDYNSDRGPNNSGGAEFVDDAQGRAAKTDGTNGTPRTGMTTEPQNAGVNFIIKI